MGEAGSPSGGRLPATSRAPVADAARPGTGPVVALAVVMASAAVLLTAGANATGWRPVHLPGVNSWVLLAAFAAAECLPVHFELRREAISMSLTTIPQVIGLFALGPWAFLAARLGGSGAALVLLRRQAPLKLGVNLACFGLEAAVAAAVFRVIAPSGQTGIATWPAVFAAAAAASFVNAGTLASAISLYQRRWEGSLTISMGFIPVLAMVEASLAVVAVTLLATQPFAVLPLTVVSALVLASYRIQKSLREKHQDLERLYDFSSLMSQALREDRVIPTLLHNATELMHAEVAWLTLNAGEEGLLHLTLDEAGCSVTVPATADTERLHHAAHAAGGATLLQTAAASPGAHDVLAAPLVGSSGPVGTLVVVDRSGRVRRFSQADLRRMAALAGHATVALEHSDLVDRLRRKAAESEHQSLHDALTGLPNRMLFARKLDQLLEANAMVAVLLVDLDRFKEVNDALGHHNGDLLLRQVGERLQGTLRRTDLIARLGGDEFAVLLADIQSDAAAVNVARGMVQLLEQPFPVGDMLLHVGASVGIAVAPRHGRDAGSLLQRADVAMYTAKSDQTGVEIYTPERDGSSAERLALVSELRQAIRDRSLEVHYQPQVHLSDGGVFGLEALVRWPHPTKGLIPPDEFISVAEHTGLISPLTHLVLDKALADVRRWWDAGWSLRVSVNLSARSLLQPDVVGEISGLLRRHRVSASALCLEITESSIMSDPRRTVAVLETFRAQGITIAVDDFGTGHSSLAYLKKLPVGEIKIDKSFVLSMLAEPDDEAIVRSVVDLARNLRLPVVAEGVEDDETMERLRGIGCHAAQGYVLSRPIGASQMTDWLAAHMPVPSRPGLSRTEGVVGSADGRREPRATSGAVTSLSAG